MEKNDKTLYSIIVEYIKDKINSGVFLPEQQIPTEMHLAHQFKVSRITSKRALVELERDGIIIRKKGSGSFVKAKIKAKENEINSSKIISIILPFEYSYGKLMKTITGVSDYIQGKGYFLDIQNGLDQFDEGKDFLSNISEGKIKGIIYYPLSDRTNMEFLTNLYMNEFPIVTIDKYFESLPISYVVSDNYAGSYEMTKYLIELGHKKIAYVSNVGIEDATSVRNRYMGYCRALKDNSIMIDSEVIILNYEEKIKQIDMNFYEETRSIKPISNPKNKKFFKDIIRKLMQQGATAIQCVNDITAIYILKVCLEMKIDIPNQLSIVGFDNTELSEHLEVPLTTVEQDFYNIGRKSAEILIKNIEMGKYEYQKEILPVSLIKRQSSGIIRRDKLIV